MGRLLLKEFETEIEKIKLPELKQVTKKILMACSDENAHRAASSSGKYHPESDLGEGGLVRHTKLVCRNIETIMKMWPQYDLSHNWDIAYISCLLHDMCKYTEKNQQHSHGDHPLRMADKVKEFKNSYQDNDSKAVDAFNNNLDKIADNIASHMSRWNTDFNGNETGKLPKTMENAFVAISDMLASQKWFESKFEGNKLC